MGRSEVKQGTKPRRRSTGGIGPRTRRWTSEEVKASQPASQRRAAVGLEEAGSVYLARRAETRVVAGSRD